MKSKKIRRAIYKNIFVAVVIALSLNLLTTAVLASPKYSKKNEFFPGDALTIELIDIYKKGEGGALDISGTYTIDSRGNIMLPLVGAYKVIGHNRFALAEKLTEVYKPYFTEPYITITPLIRLTLMGPFFRPGSYRLSPESSLWEAIEMAGGPRENCDLNSIQVKRNDEIVIEDLLASFEKGYSLEDIGIKSGDQIIAAVQNEFGMRQVFEYLKFGMSLASFYLLVLRWQSYSSN